jgi:toxin YoeB
MYLIKFSKAAEKDKKELKRAGLEKKVKELLNIIRENPYQIPPSYEKLVGNLEGNYSRRISIQHRLVYEVRELDMDIISEEADMEYDGIIFVKRMWTHYEKVK